MRQRLNVAALLLAAVAVVLTGCKTPPPEKPAEMAIKDPSELREGQEKIVWQRPEKVPEWVDSPGMMTEKKEGSLYFVGVGLPNEYEQKANESAAMEAGTEAARYLFNLVDEKNFISDKLRNSQGYVPVQSLARDTVGKNVVSAIVRDNYGVARFTQFCCKKEYGAEVNFYKVYRLFELPKKAVVDAVKGAQEQVQQEYQRERDEQKKELLKGSEDMLKAMEKELSGEK